MTDPSSTPPSDPVAEAAVLGCCLLDPGVIPDLGLRAEDFYGPAHRRVWQAILAMVDRGDPVDPVTLYREVERQGWQEWVPRETVISLTEAVTSPVHAQHYAGHVAEKSAARRLLVVAREIIGEVEAGAVAADCVRKAQDGLSAILSGGSKAGPSHIQNALEAILARLEGKAPPGAVLPTGYGTLDDLHGGGLRPGELVVVAARPSMGKSALAANLVRRAGLAGKTALVFSLEMTREAIATNILAAQASISQDRLRKGGRFLTQDDLAAIATVAASLSDTGIYLDDNASARLSTIRSEAQRLKSKAGLDLLVIDYLQLMEAQGGSRSRQEDVSALSRGLKILARDLEVPVVALSQLNRGAEQREGHRPRLSDLRESGAIEQDADTVWLLHRPYYYSRAENERRLAEVIVAKQRHGPTDTVRLTFDADTLLFSEQRPGDFC